MNFEELTEYRKDLKNLLKKYRTLSDDLDVVKKVLTTAPNERPPFSFRIDNLGLETCVIKKKDCLQSVERKRSKFGIATNLCLLSRRTENNLYRTVS